MNLLYNILFALLGFLAIILEFFVPSAGVIGVLGIGFVIIGIVFTFINYGLIIGTIFLISVLIIGPIVFFVYFKLFPKSYIGKKLILNNKYTNEQINENQKLLNCTGISATNLRPVGEGIINNQRYNVTTQGDYIEKDKKIRVIKLEGNNIVVTLEE